jgi:UDP-N-acetylmuramyl pentapeptide synthase
LDSHIAATDVESKGGRLSFTVHRRRFSVPVWGRHHLTAALSAIAVGRLLGVTWSEITGGLAAYRPLEQRCQVWHSGGVTAIEETSGRSRAALRAGFAVLNEVAVHGRRVVLCNELFDDEAVGAGFPGNIGQEAITQAGADLVIAAGHHADLIAQGAQAAGASSRRAIALATADETLPALRSLVRPGDAVLCCGRPSNALKQALAAMKATPLERAA